MTMCVIILLVYYLQEVEEDPIEEGREKIKKKCNFFRNLCPDNVYVYRTVE